MGSEAENRWINRAREDLLGNYVGVGGVAERLGIHRESVRRLIRQGHLPGIKFSNKWLVERHVLAQFADGYVGRPGTVSQGTLALVDVGEMPRRGGRRRGFRNGGVGVCNICRRKAVWDDGRDRYCRVHEPLPAVEEGVD